MRTPRFSKKRHIVEIDPDEIFLDSRNLPDFDRSQLEGRLEKPIGKKVMRTFAGVALLVGIVLVSRLYTLQIAHGAEYAKRSEENRLEETPVFARRGVLYDRKGVELAWNTEEASSTFSGRAYTTLPGLGHLLGYVNLPQQDSTGKFYQTDTTGIAGVERSFNDALSGTNGDRVIEVDAHGNIHSESVLAPPKDGENITLSIDSRLQTELYHYIKSLADQIPFTGGAGGIMDVNTGEILALTSYPEYDPNVLTNGSDAKLIQSYNTDPRKPFLDRFISGLYTPGSIVKPFMAIGALETGVITPDKQILSIGYINVPNPYDPSHPSRFNDWRPQGWVDMRQAIAVSSDVYFYEIGGGFEDQPGMGIANIEKYATMFGLAQPTGIAMAGEGSGTIPSPEWKAKVFNGEPWRVGDTYNTVIGQYGFQVTPIQMLRAVSSIANGGTLFTPSLIASTTLSSTTLDIPEADFEVAREGMRQSVEVGVASGLNISNVEVAAKTGTAQLGVDKQFDNSWVMGFFPYEHPRYAFVVIMEHGPITNTLGGTYVMRQMLDWMTVHTPEYLQD
jgi:penicillin-binding protein 2